MIILGASRKSSTPVLLRSSEKRIVVSPSGNSFYAPRGICHEVWDVRVRIGEILTDLVGGEGLARKGIVGDCSLTVHAFEVSSDLACAIEAMSSGSVVKAYTPWNDTSVQLWSGTKRWVLGGGVVQGGDEIAKTTTKLLERRLPGTEVRVSSFRRWNGLIGAAEFLPVEAFRSREETITFIAVDLGGSSEKIGLVNVDGRTGKIKRERPLIGVRVEDRPENIRRPNQSDTVKEKLELSGRTCEWIAGSIRDMIIKASERKIKLAPFIVLGMPFEVDETGRRKSGGTYPFPSSDESDFKPGREIGDKLGKLLREALYCKIIKSEGNIQDYYLTVDNDAIIAAAATFTGNIGEKVGYLGLGSGVGGALYLNPQNHEFNKLF